jgi:hypothetical protein
MNITNSQRISLLAELDKLYSIWKEERISKRSLLSEEECKTLLKKAHTFFILDT